MTRRPSIPITQLRTASLHVSFLTVMIFFSMYSRLLLAPLLIYLQTDLGIGTAEATSLFIPLSIAYAAAMLSSGYLATRMNHRRTIALSAVVLGVGLIVFGVSHDLPVLYGSSALIGAGAGLYPPSGVASVTELVHEDIRGRAIALHEVGPNLAFVIAPLVVTFGVSVASWRWVTNVSGIVAIVAGLAFDRRALAGGFPGEAPRLKTIVPLLKRPEFWAIVVLFSLAASSTIGVYSILPTFLVQSEGQGIGTTNALLSVSRISGVLVVLVAGVLLDTFGVRRIIFVVFLTTGLLTIGIGVLRETPMLVMVFLQPIIITAFFPAAVGAMADLGPPTVRNVAVSLIIPVVNVISNGVFPSLMGALTEAGAVRGGFIGLGALMIASTALLPLVGDEGRERRR